MAISDHQRLTTPPPSAVLFCPHWRWKRLLRCIDSRDAPPRTVADAEPELYAAFFMHKKMLKIQNEDQALEVSLSDPDVFSAITLYTDSWQADTKWVLEAMLMTGMTSLDISQRYVITARTAHVYEKLFFDVRAVLPYPMFVMAKILAPIIYGDQVGDHDYQPKLIGYLGGMDMLHRYLHPTDELPTEMWHRLATAVRKNVLKNAMVASTLVKPNQYNAIELQDLHIRMEQHWQMVKTTSGTAASMEDWIQHVMTTITETVGDAFIMPPTTFVAETERPLLARISKQLTAYEAAAKELV